MAKQIGLQALTLDTLGDLNAGVVRIAFDQAIKRVCDDLGERHTMDAPREIVLKVRFDPVMDHNEHIADVDIKVDVSAKIPSATLISRAIVQGETKVNASGEIVSQTVDLLFSRNVPENARQRHIDDYIGESNT